VQLPKKPAFLELECQITCLFQCLNIHINVYNNLHSVFYCDCADDRWLFTQTFPFLFRSTRLEVLVIWRTTRVQSRMHSGTMLQVQHRDLPRLARTCRRHSLDSKMKSKFSLYRSLQWHLQQEIPHLEVTKHSIPPAWRRGIHSTITRPSPSAIQQL
jgi:hypothetical protein